MADRINNLSRQFTDSEREVDGRIVAAMAQPMVSGAIGTSVGQTYDWMKEDLAFRSGASDALSQEQAMTYAQSGRAELDRQARQQAADDAEAHEAMKTFQGHLASGMDYKQAYQENLKANPNLPFNDRYKDLMREGENFFETDRTRQVRQAREANDLLRLNEDTGNRETKLQVLKDNPDLAKQYYQGLKNAAEQDYYKSETDLAQAKSGYQNIGRANELADLTARNNINVAREKVDTYGQDRALREKTRYKAIQDVDEAIRTHPQESQLADAIRGRGLLEAQDALAAYPDSKRLRELSSQMELLEADEKLGGYEKAKRMRGLLQDIGVSKAEHELQQLPASQQLEELVQVNAIRAAEEHAKRYQHNPEGLSVNDEADMIGALATAGISGVTGTKGLLREFPSETSSHVLNMLGNADWISKYSNEEKGELRDSLNTLNRAVKPGDIVGQEALEKARANIIGKTGAYIQKNKNAMAYNDRQKAMNEQAKSIKNAFEDTDKRLDSALKLSEGDSTKSYPALASHAGAFLRQALGTNELNDLAVQEYAEYLKSPALKNMTPEQQAGEIRNQMSSFMGKVIENNATIFNNKGEIPKTKLDEAKNWVNKALKGKAAEKPIATPAPAAQKKTEVPAGAAAAGGAKVPTPKIVQDEINKFGGDKSKARQSLESQGFKF